MYSKYTKENCWKQRKTKKGWRGGSTDKSTCCARETLKFLTLAPTEKPDVVSPLPQHQETKTENPQSKLASQAGSRFSWCQTMS